MLKTVLDTLDGLDEAIKPFYTEKDGKFTLQVEGVDHHPDVANLKSAYERVKEDRANIMAERDALKAKLSAFPEDFDADKWAKAKQGKTVDEAALVELRKTLEAEKAKETERANDLEAKLNRFGMERDLDDALRNAGVTDPALCKGARAILASSVKTSDEGKAYVETDMGPLPLADHVQRWAASEGKAFVTPAKGGDLKNSKSGNVQKKWGDMTSAEKVALHQENPEEYNRVKLAG